METGLEVQKKAKVFANNFENTFIPLERESDNENTTLVCWSLNKT